MFSRATSGHARRFQTFNLTAGSEFQVLPRNQPLIDEPMNFYNAMPQFEDTGHDMDNIQFVHPIRISRSGPWRLYFLRYLTSSAKCFALSTASTKADFRKIGSTALHKIYTKIAFTHPNFFSKEEPRYVQLQCLMATDIKSRTLFWDICLITYSSVLKMLRLQVMIHPISCFPLADEHRGL